MIPTVKLICSSFSSVIATLQACMRLALTSRCVKSPRHLSHTMNAVGITCQHEWNNTHVEKARADEISVIRELGVWEVVDRPRDEVVLGTRWVDINKGDEHKTVLPQSTGRARRQTSSRSQPLHRSKLCEVCGSVQQLTSSPMSWDIRFHGLAHFCCLARRNLFVELLEEADTDNSEVGRLLRSMYGCRDAGVIWEFAICQVTIAIGLVQGRASPCTNRHLQKQLCVVTRRRLCSSRLHRQCQMVLCETAGVLCCHESRNPWTSWIPRLCAKHSTAGQDRGMDR